ncbi:MAG: Na+:solute symporter [Candidatus Latescibacteria bacterium]|nr:Na+:solute symporter [Candidatus Latescibacterota bacterium]
MILNAVDWLFIILYFAFSLGVGVAFSKRAGASIQSFFVSGRSLPWWLVGTSMVATTFAADTPLAVTGMVVKDGIAGNWLWWNMVLSGIMTVFLYARLWRRAEVITDVEFTEIRYSGKPAAILRGFRALYLAIPITCITMGWVILAMSKIVTMTMGIDKWLAISICLLVTVIYSTFSGFWGVVVTDFFQFLIAMTGSIMLSVYAVSAVGGIEALKAKVIATSPHGTAALNFLPRLDGSWLPLSTIFVYIAVIWWAAWYPGAEPGGGGYIAQRMFAAKDEKHSQLAALWFNIAHYALRPWPWILVALTAIVLYPDSKDAEAGYISVMIDHMPPYLRGLMLASFAAAFMSTISTLLNVGSSYVINDFYMRFIKKGADQKHYVFVSRLTTVFILIIAAIVTMMMESVVGAFKFMMTIGAGTGLVYILRWFWWRINAWSEITAMTVSLVTASILMTMGYTTDTNEGFTVLMLVTTIISTTAWIIVTFLTKPVSDEKLISFYRRVQPGGRLWKNISDRIPENELIHAKPHIGLDFLNWILGSLSVWFFLFGIGRIIIGPRMHGFLYLIAGVILFIIIRIILSNKDKA